MHFVFDNTYNIYNNNNIFLFTYSCMFFFLLTFSWQIHLNFEVIVLYHSYTIVLKHLLYKLCNMIAYVKKTTMIKIIYPLLVVSYISIESLNLSFISYRICVILMFCFNWIRSHKIIYTNTIRVHPVLSVLLLNSIPRRGSRTYLQGYTKDFKFQHLCEIDMINYKLFRDNKKNSFWKSSFETKPVE
ncbi:hypothetical protein AGLY_011611 [Aphis glycines]|uniref:Uncharacterized protein n=1 Tax=Aphis glycines TaxID=307491 RepID=A0A6G0TB27_APHGL|nr:hypothetical protein AGLY_011611 [Aphis glycines]